LVSEIALGDAASRAEIEAYQAEALVLAAQAMERAWRSSSMAFRGGMA
jgi:hypothetical protein